MKVIMRREKFIYNRQTLRYEKVVEPLSTTLLRIFGFVCAAVFTAFILTLVTHRYFPSPSERLLHAENSQLKLQLEHLGDEMGRLSTVLDNVQERDAYAHRLIFGMDPIDGDVWEGGIGGHEAYDDLRQYKYSGDLMAEIRQKMDQLKHRINLQSRSLDSITMMANNQTEMRAAIPSIKPIRSDKLNRGIKLLSGFGTRIHPVHKVRKMHWGIDFSAPSKTPIQATGAGEVIFAGRKDGYGNCVEIDHGFGYKTLYAHMSKIAVKRGEKVVRGQEIGLVGSTGTSTAPHCHYEVTLRGQKVDPIQYCLDGLTPSEYQELVEAASVQNQSFD